MTEHVPGCEAVDADLAELALGVLTGRERASAIAHLERCERCAAETKRLAAAADELVAAAPEADPPPGFEVVVLERMEHERHPTSRRARRPIVLAALAAGLAVLAGIFSLGRLSAQDTERAASSRDLPLSVVGSHGRLRLATYYTPGSPRRKAGEIYLYLGRPAWIYMAVDNARATEEVTCEVTSSSGRTARLGSFWLSAGRGAWAARIPVGMGTLQSARLVSLGGTVLASAVITPSSALPVTSSSP